MNFIKLNSFTIVKFVYIILTTFLVFNSIKLNQNAFVIVCLFILNILWIYKWNHQQKLTKKYLSIFFIFTTMAIFCTKPVWESDYARYFIDGVHSAKKIPVYKTIPSKSQYRSDFKQAWKESQYNNYGSIYPGLSVLFFKIVVLLSNYDYSKFIYIFKLFALIIGLSIAFLISKYKYDRYDYKIIILSTFHPLLILEWYVNLHFDFLFALCIVLFVYANKQFLKIAALTLGFHVKYLIFLFYLFQVLSTKKLRLIFSSLYVS